MTIEFGKLRSAGPANGVNTRGLPAADVKVIKGYGHLIWWPFALVIIALGLLSRDSLLIVTSSAFAISMAWLGVRVPYLTFACFYQAMIGMCGGAYLGAYGRYPGGVADNELVPLALAYLQLTLFVVTFVYWLIARRDTPGDPRMGQSQRVLRLSPNQLFVLLLVLFVPEWLKLPLQPSSTGGFRQIALHLVNFRYVLFGLFVINALRVNKKKIYYLLIAISLYISLPLSVTGSADWSSIAVILLMYAAGALVFSSVKGGVRLSPAIMAACVAAVVFLGGFGLIWEGGMKLAWRTTLNTGGGGGSMVSNISMFADETQEVIRNFDLSYSLEQLTSRMSSGEGFSSLVLRNVPKSIPYANGERIMSALQNLVPRILFPNKQDLGGDSWLVRKYANIVAAGDESGTSIGLGYVSELYVDFGMFGIIGGAAMIGSIFAGGVLLLRRFAGGGDIAAASLVTMLFAVFATPDASLTKMISSIVFGLMVFTVTGYLSYRYLYIRYAPNAGASSRSKQV